MRNVTVKGYGTGSNFRVIQRYKDKPGIYMRERVLVSADFRFSKVRMQFRESHRPYLDMYAGKISAVRFNPHDVIDPSLPEGEHYEVKFNMSTAPDIDGNWNFNNVEVVELIGKGLFGFEHQYDPDNYPRPYRPYGIEIPAEYTEAVWQDVPIECDIAMLYSPDGASVVTVKTSDEIVQLDSKRSGYVDIVADYVRNAEFYDDSIKASPEEYFITADLAEDQMLVSEKDKRKKEAEAQSAAEKISVLTNVKTREEELQDALEAKLQGEVAEGIESAKAARAFDKAASDVDKRIEMILQKQELEAAEAGQDDKADSDKPIDLEVYDYNEDVINRDMAEELSDMQVGDAYTDEELEALGFTIRHATIENETKTTFYEQEVFDRMDVSTFDSDPFLDDPEDGLVVPSESSKTEVKAESSDPIMVFASNAEPETKSEKSAKKLSADEERMNKFFGAADVSPQVDNVLQAIIAGKSVDEGELSNDNPLF